MVYQAIQNLPSGPLDIVGDVHGEMTALQALLRHLGYSETGCHPAGRSLVFVGDLCDRGPDSPAVLSWVQQAQQAGYARMVLGNHELNVLAGEPKDGSGWFFFERVAKDQQAYAPFQTMPPEQKSACIHWLAQQPVVLQRPDLRIVHAAWVDEAVQQVRQSTFAEGVAAQYWQWEEDWLQQQQQAGWHADYQREQQIYADILEDSRQTPPPMPGLTQYDWQRSRQHPLRVLTSGTSEIVAQPFFAGARWRFTGRSSWWRHYQEDVPVVIGHYWRNWYAGQAGMAAEKLFEGAPNAWLGAKNNVFCIDYSVGARWRDRRAEPPVPPTDSRFRLGALRWPERVLVFDDGEQADTVGFAGQG